MKTPRAGPCLLLVLLLFSCGLFTSFANQSTTFDVDNLAEARSDFMNGSDIQELFNFEKTPQTSDSPEMKSTVLSDSKVSQEYIFAETVSQNSVISNGLADTGQPMLIKLMDNAAIELANAARNVDIVDHDKILSNVSELNTEHIATNINYTEDSGETLDEFKNESIQATQELLKNNDSKNIDESKEIENIVIFDAVEQTEVKNVSVENNLSAENVTELKSEPDLKPVEPQEDIPSFSEWTQKQLEEAERNKETVLNDSSHLVHNTITSTVNLKVRSKNYASPDCGAKIVAANPEAGSASFILSSSRDEYMLNTCNSRIWFIVELCEAIQAKKVDLANFELFSSTPKNFSVYVSDRFPTREWAGVGQFTAQDERDIQTFNLHPHLFGKFIKVEMHSHYGSEHYCPISLFRAYGTSEYEVFETENSPQSQANPLDDDDDDVLEELTVGKKDDLSRNLFGSARDAVMSIMKKAAEVLVKSSDSKNSTSQLTVEASDKRTCRTPSHIIVCDNCSNSLFTEVYDLMSCHNDYIKSFTEIPIIYNVLCNTELCQHYGLDFKSKKTLLFKTEIASYISALLMPSCMAALCNMLAIIEKKVVLNTSYETDLNITSNLTIDKKINEISNGGLIDALIQDPFQTCNGDEEYCKDKIINNIKLETEPIVEILTQPETEINYDLEINPTKTHKADQDSVEDNVLTVYPSIDSNSFIPQSLKTTSVGYDMETSEMSKNTEPFKDIKNEEAVFEHKNESEDNIHQSSQNEIMGSENIDSVIVSSEGTENNENSSFNNNNSNNVEDVNTSQEQLSLDSLLSEFDQANNDPSTVVPPTNSIPTSPQGQKESVFLRLSNRIKALEKNMSLSSQYLEELSRRYKKQVEEMQKTFEKTILNMNEESKRIEERDHKNIEEMLVLQQQIAQLSASVNMLLSEKDGWIGNGLFYKIILFQIILTILTIIIMYFRTRNRYEAPNNNSSRINERRQLEKFNLRRNSAEDSLGNDFILRRRLSDDASMHSSRSGDLIERGIHKCDRKKRKRKTSTVHRSLSIAGTPENFELRNINSNKSSGESSKTWPENNLNIIDTPVALEESEFIIPESESVNFNALGEFSNLVFSEVTPKKEFNKVNGSILGVKSSPNDKKTTKVRRLSSPAFFKTALGKTNLKNGNEFVGDIETRPNTEVLTRRDMKSEERELKIDVDDSTLHEWSSAGDVSQASSSNTTNSNPKSKRSKKRSFKNMLKKVF